MSDLKERLTTLSPEKRAALERLLLKRLAAARNDQGIPRRASTGPAPLSLAQHSLWFLNQMELGSPAYNAALGISLTGTLNLAALSKSFDSIVERHEILRTTYEVLDGSPVQVIQPVASAATRLLDARPIPSEKRDAAIAQLIRSECRRPFDLVKDLMMRTTVVRLSHDKHIVLIVAHHIACDGWTRTLLFHEISRWYSYHSLQQPHGLAPLSIQYVDFAVWQRATLLDGAIGAQVAYWTKQLAGVPQQISLPTDFQRPTHQKYAGAHLFFELPLEVSERLVRTSREEGTTLYITGLALFNVLLCALSGQDDILVGTPSGNRVRLEIEPLMGLFANTLVIRTRLTGNPNFRTLLRRVKETALEAYSNADVPFGKLVESLRLPRDLSRNPLFQVNFRFRTATGPELTLPGLEVRHMNVDIGTSKFDLALELSFQSGKIEGYFEYSTALFQKTSIDRIRSEFLELVGELTSMPETPLGELLTFTRIRKACLRVGSPDAETLPSGEHSGDPEYFAGSPR